MCSLGIPKRAESAWSLLNGMVCLYKPPDVSTVYVEKKLKTVLCKELNDLKTRPADPYIEVNRTSSGISVNVRPSYADNVLCTGPRYQPGDISVNFPSKLTPVMSGVLRINQGKLATNMISKCNFTKCFHIKGVLGLATKDFHINSKVLARAKFEHIQKYHLERILASYQSASQRRMFQEYQVDLTSQEAYDIAVKGIYRPHEKATPVIYSLKTVTFEPPNFTLEVQCINETEDYLKNLIHNLGVSLKCLATCSGMRCTRYGCFHVEDSLVTRHWTLVDILQNMKHCFSKLEETFPKTIGHVPTVTVAKVPPGRQ